jgi:hypothetical protein
MDHGVTNQYYPSHSRASRVETSSDSANHGVIGRCAGELRVRWNFGPSRPVDNHDSGKGSSRRREETRSGPTKESSVFAEEAANRQGYKDRLCLEGKRGPQHRFRQKGSEIENAKQRHVHR